MRLTEKKCLPCEGDVDPLPESKADELNKEVPSWKIDRSDTHKIKKQFEFDDFKAAMKFVNRMADIAENEGHHPDFTVEFNKVSVALTTHAISGLSENDFIMAAKIEDAA